MPANTNTGVTLTGLSKTAAFGGHTPGAFQPWAKIAYAILVSRYATCIGELIATFDMPAPITALVLGHLEVNYTIAGGVTLTGSATILGNIVVNFQFPVTASANVTGEIIANFLRRGSQQAECLTGEGPPEIEGEEEDYVLQ
jgi:hypothetical protein